MRQFIPEKKQPTGGPTPRDLSNLALIGFFSTIITWVVCDLLGAHWVPKEVSASFGGILGYLVARRFKY